MFGTAVVAAASPMVRARATEIAAELAPLARWSSPERFAALVEAMALAKADPRGLRLRFDQLQRIMGHDGYA